MRDLWPTVKDALLLIPFLIIGGVILSQFFGGGVVTGIIAVTGILSLLGRRRQRRTTSDDTNDYGTDETGSTDADTTTDSPGPDVEPQSQAYSFSDTDDTREPLNRTGLRRSNDDILEESGAELRNQIEIYDDGTIDLDNYDDLDLYRQLMLYVVAKRMAYEDRFIDTPNVTVTDINDRPEFDYNKIELLLFLREAQNWLIPPTDQDPPVSTIDYADLDDAAFTVKTRSLSKIADWIFEVPLPNTPPSHISSQLSNAAMMLDEARSEYDRVREDGVTNNDYNADHRYDPVRQKILRACKDARHYPVVFDRDNAWTEYTEYAEALLDFFENDLYTKTEHCLPRMEQYRQQMKEKADDAAYI